MRTRLIASAIVMTLALVASAGAQTPAPTGEPAATELTGTVLSSGNIMVLVRGDDGQDRSLVVFNTTQMPDERIAAGERVKVRYRPIDGERFEAVSLERAAGETTPRGDRRERKRGLLAAGAGDRELAGVATARRRRDDLRSRLFRERPPAPPPPRRALILGVPKTPLENLRCPFGRRRSTARPRCPSISTHALVAPGVHPSRRDRCSGRPRRTRARESGGARGRERRAADGPEPRRGLGARACEEGLAGRADARLPFPHRGARPEAELLHHGHRRDRARGGAGGRGGDPARQLEGPAARHPDRAQGPRGHPGRTHDRSAATCSGTACRRRTRRSCGGSRRRARYSSASSTCTSSRTAAPRW